MKNKVPLALAGSNINLSRSNYFSKLAKNIKNHYELYILSIPALLYILIFQYIPIYGIQIAFKNFYPKLGFFGSPWIGFEHFIRFFSSYNFWQLISNTVQISVLTLVVGFPLPILLALMLNEVRNKRFKKTLQMITYAPHFISVVVIVGMMMVFLSPTTGIVNNIIVLMGGTPISFLSEPEWFKTLYISSNVWQNMGWGSIIYLSALSGVDIQLYDSAYVDGASKLQKIWNVDIPAILPTIVVLLILQTGGLMSVGFEKILLMQNNLNMSASDVFSTYIYRLGITLGDYSFTTAVSLFNSTINVVLLIVVNRIARKITETSLW